MQSHPIASRIYIASKVSALVISILLSCLLDVGKLETSGRKKLLGGLKVESTEEVVEYLMTIGDRYMIVISNVFGLKFGLS